MRLLVSEYQYFSPLTWFSGLYVPTHCIFYVYDEYRKMSFRNRCVIAGANGPMNLSVPILGGRNVRIPTTAVLIDNRLPWQLNHWKSICSCYNHAPWFTEYSEGCREIFEQRFETLVDLNRFVLNWIITQLKLPFTWEEGELPGESGWLDYRNKFNPKLIRNEMGKIKYRQVFQERTGFIPNLSVLDLLFCTGPRAGELLQ